MQQNQTHTHSMYSGGFGWWWWCEWCKPFFFVPLNSICTFYFQLFADEWLHYTAQNHFILKYVLCRLIWKPNIYHNTPSFLCVVRIWCWCWCSNRKKNSFNKYPVHNIISHHLIFDVPIVRGYAKFLHNARDRRVKKIEISFLSALNAI